MYEEMLPLIARKILLTFKGRKVFAFSGSLGAGKTSLIRSLCRQLGVGDKPTSPSFGIVNEYRTDQGEAVYHFDFYRIKDLEEAYAIGYEEYFFGGHYCLIEWPEKIGELLPPDCVYIRIEDPGEGQKRFFTFDPEQ
jgi:tRNA threonylcarbamoyladenosine biosynthesis protein TsaE